MPAPCNPFPGLNPYFQANWDNVHHWILGAVYRAIAEELPSDLMVRVEERVQVAESAQEYRPDVAIAEPWQGGFPPVWTPEDANASRLAVTEPTVIFVEPERDRWLEIRDVRGRVITALEVPSPTNKSEGGWRGYRQKQQDFLAAGINLIEVDLIRGGQHVVAVPLERFSSPVICVARQLPGYNRREIYPCPLREPLPTIRVPLRAGDPDVPLAFQPIIDECYRTGRYWLADYQRPLNPPIAEEDSTWVNERLRAAGLI